VAAGEQRQHQADSRALRDLGGFGETSDGSQSGIDPCVS